MRRWLSIDWDPSEAIEVATKIDQRIGEYIRTGGGRLLRGSTFYEDLIKTICTTNASWAYTKRMVSSLVLKIGNGTFPSPRMILDCGYPLLKEYAKMGYRNQFVFRATEQCIQENITDLEGEQIYPDIDEKVIQQIRGIGPYACAHMKVLLLDHSSIPIDSDVVSYCQKQFGLQKNVIQEHYDAWGKYKFLGYKFSRIVDG